ncbi:carboxypeptidase-like regulatory domain-containing protein [uncultured Paludibaculum sp.]|uniref:carboxypeptidase-like regulatory domain-containing protein n=1 Tax=uncultured Paludibaculum sp. TaxID=1765020 RepID=UPI002AAAB55F|nr:carboxypeptidase-like regulatory domain-containing protein [uncultured Paludibaculum sp.]
MKPQRNRIVRYKYLVSALILAIGTAAAQPERNGSIAGQVVNAATGAPLNRVTVNIMVEGRPNIRGMAPTAADGNFVLRALPPGEYVIHASKAGYAGMTYGARQPESPGQVIILGPNENKSGLVIRLWRYSTIAGTVIGAGGGLPTGSSVTAYRQEFPRGKPGWVRKRDSPIDDRGRYRLSNLQPGRYIVSARQIVEPAQYANAPRSPEEPDLQPVPAVTYHPSSVIQQEAVAVDLAPGATVRDIDIAVQALTPTRLSVRTQLPPGVNQEPTRPVEGQPYRPGFYAPVWIRDVASGPAAPLQSITANARPTPMPLALLPGRYRLSSSAEFEGKCYAAQQEVTLAGGLVEVELVYAPCINLAGHLRIVGPGSHAGAGLRVDLVPGEPVPTWARSAEVQPDGSFVIKNVPPGIWDIGARPVPRDGYVQSMMLGKLDVLTQEMVITTETSDSLEIVLSTRAAQLRGRVEGGLATAVLAAPQGEAARVLSFYGLSGVDEKGEFEIRNLTPGSYRIYAFESMTPLAWFDPEFLKGYPGQGTLVELAEGQAPDIKVTAIPGAAAERRTQ